MTDFEARRRIMVDTQIRPSDVTKFPIIDAFLSVPRERFVPDTQSEAAYAGETLDIGGGRVLLDARTFAKMLDAVDVGPDALVLDIGCGLGYSTAVIARLAQAVVGVEADDSVVSDAEAILSETGADNVVLQAGPLADGAAEHGPYDIVIIEGGVEYIPQALLTQLKDGGRIAAIFVAGGLGAVRLGLKRDGHVSWRFAFNASAPVLDGFRKAHAFVL
jgi:protein-L-isoaspartate(D-aspartate) O-methyltransferase